MLALDRTFGPFGDLAVWGDHAEPSRFYYLPGRPRLARGADGAPELSLVIHRAEGGVVDDGARLGGGILSFTTELVAAPEDLELAREALRREGFSSPELVPAPTRGGVAKLAWAVSPEGAPKGGFALVERVLGEVTPELSGTQRAVFSMTLPSLEAALVLAGILRHEGTSPIGVRYELEVTGLRPAIQASIVARYDRVYASLQTDFGLGGAYQGIGVDIDLGFAVQKLKQSGAIEVEILELSDEGDLRARTETVLHEFQQDLVRRFFQPSLGPTKSFEERLLEAVTAAAQAAGAATMKQLLEDSGLIGAIAKQLGVSPAAVRGVAERHADDDGASGKTPFSLRLALTLKQVSQEELKTERLDYRIAAAEKRTFAPQGLLEDLLLPGDPPSITEVTLGGDLLERVRVQVTPTKELAALGVERLLVHLEHPAVRGEGSPSPTAASLSFTPDALAPQAFSAWVGGDGQRAYRYRVEVWFASAGGYQGAAPSLSTEWLTAEAGQLVVSPLAWMTFRTLELSSAGLDFHDAPQVDVELVLGDGDLALSVGASLTAEAPRASVRVRHPRGASAASARAAYVLASGARVVRDDLTLVGDTLLVPGPFRAARTLRLVPVLPPGFVDAYVTVDLEEPGHVAQQSLSLIAGDTKAHALTLPALSEPPPPVTVQWFITRADGSFFESARVVTDAPVLVVTDRAEPSRRVEVELVGPSKLADAAIAAVKVELLGEGDLILDGALFTDSRRARVVWAVPAAPGADLAYRYRVVRFGLDGRAQAEAPRDGREAVLLVPARA